MGLMIIGFIYIYWKSNLLGITKKDLKLLELCTKELWCCNKLICRTKHYDSVFSHPCLPAGWYELSPLNSLIKYPLFWLKSINIRKYLTNQVPSIRTRKFMHSVMGTKKPDCHTHSGFFTFLQHRYCGTLKKNTTKPILLQSPNPRDQLDHTAVQNITKLRRLWW